MHYFPAMTGTVTATPNDETTESELLFYLVTCRFAQWLCRRRRQNFALESEGKELSQTNRYRSTVMQPDKCRIIST
jgi:hypothetical protein